MPTKESVSASLMLAPKGRISVADGSSQKQITGWDLAARVRAFQGDSERQKV
jgi:hypothetical protein